MILSVDIQVDSELLHADEFASFTDAELFHADASTQIPDIYLLQPVLVTDFNVQDVPFNVNDWAFNN